MGFLRYDPLDRLIDRAAASGKCVLIWKDNVTERRAIAATIHERSPRRARLFVHFSRERLRQFLEDDFRRDVAAHVHGALPISRPSFLEKPSGGTILIDDVSTLDLATQAMLFHAWESETTTRTGGTSVDAPGFIFATGADLRPLVKEGRFREDFFRKIARNAICLTQTRDLFLPEPLEFERKFVEFPNPIPCLKCTAPSRKFRQLRDGYLICGTCAQSFTLGHE
jgi:DNA-binding NtrC family response regulator